MVGEDPELDAKRFRRSEKRHLPDHPGMIDRLGRAETMQVLSVASEIFPLVKTGGLADVAGALPVALAGEGVSVRTLVPGYPAVMEPLQDEEGRCINMPTAAGRHGFGPCRPGRRARPVRPRRAASLRPPRRSLWRRRPARLAGQLAALCGAEPGRRRHRRRRASPATQPDLVHAHDWQAAPDAGLHALRQGGRRADRASPSTIWPSRASSAPASSASSACRAQAMALDGVEYYGGVGFLKAGLQAAMRHHHGQPDLCPGNPDAGIRHGPRRAHQPARRRSATASSTASTPRSGTRRPTRIWSPTTTAQDAEGARVQQARRRGALRPRPRRQRRSFCVVSRLTWQKGMDVLAASVDAHRRHGCAGSPSWAPATPALEGALLAAAARAIPAASASSSAMTRRCRT